MKTTFLLALYLSSALTLTGCTQVAAKSGSEGKETPVPTAEKQQRQLYEDWRIALLTTLKAQEEEDWIQVREATSWEWPEFQDYRLYYQARAAEAAGQFTDAVGIYGRLTDELPRSLFAGEAVERRLMAQMATGSGLAILEEARAWADEAVSRGEQTRRRMSVATISMAAGQMTDATQHYREIILEAPASHAAREAQQHLDALREAGFDVQPFSRQEQLARADRLYAARAWDPANDLFIELLQDDTIGTAARQELLVQRGKTRFFRRQYPTAEALFDEARKLGRDSAHGFEAQFYFAFSQSRLGRPQRALAEYARLQDRALELKRHYGWASQAQEKIGLIHLQEKNDSQAEAEYELYLSRYPSGNHRQQVQWNLAWARYNQGNYKQARESFAARARDNDWLAPAARYWMARSDAALGREEQAREQFEAIARSMPLHYYGLLAAARLGTAPPAYPDRVRFFDEDDLTIAEQAEFHVHRGRLLAEIERFREAEQEYVAAVQAANTRQTAYAVGQSLVNIGRYSAAQRIVWSHFQSELLHADRFYTDLWTLAYPKAFAALVNKEAESRGTDPHIVLSIMREESRYRPDVASPADAFGLLQLILPTAQQVARNLGLPEPSRDDLYNPELNILLGTEYITRLLKSYDNNLFLAFAGYNGGSHNVNRWLRSFGDAELDEFIERIPFTETRNYVKKVTTSLLRYQYLYRSEEAFAHPFLAAAFQPEKAE